MQELSLQALLGGAGLGTPAYLPAHHRRQRHQDRVGAGAGLQAKERAAVVEQGELDVTAAPVELELTFAIAEGVAAAALDDRQVRGQESISHPAEELETAREAPLRQVVEEEPADAAGLPAVPQVEVVVAPALEPRVDVRAEGLAGLLRLLVPGANVVREGIVRREVETAAEPPDRVVPRPGLVRREEADVHMGGWHIGVVRVQDHRHAGRLETPPAQVRTVRGRRRRQRSTVNAREPDPCLLEDGAVPQDSRPPPAATLPLPALLGEALLAVHLLERPADPVL